MGELYNKDIKDKFLNENYSNEQTKNTIRHVFIKSEPIESVLNKDLYDFTADEIGNVIKNSNPLSSTVARSSGRFISQYISWAMSYRNSNIHPLDAKSPSWYDQFVDKTKKIHFSKDELYNEIIDNPMMLNAQDKALLSLMFEGIVGKGFSELNNIHYNNINWETNEITVEGRENPIKVSDRTIKHVEDAYYEPTYLFYNTETGDTTEKELVASGYIFKNTKSPRTKEGEPISVQTFYGRMRTIKEMFDLEYLTPNALKQSGMISMAADIAKDCIEKGKVNESGKPELGYDEFALIGEKYNVAMMENNGYRYFNTFLMREFVTQKKLKEIYNLEVSIVKR